MSGTTASDESSGDAPQADASSLVKRQAPEDHARSRSVREAPSMSGLTPNSSDWPQMGQIRDFFRSDFSTCWLGEPTCTEI